MMLKFELSTFSKEMYYYLMLCRNSYSKKMLMVELDSLFCSVLSGVCFYMWRSSFSSAITTNMNVFSCHCCIRKSIFISTPAVMVWEAGQSKGQHKGKQG